MTLPTIDSYGFLDGAIAESAVNANNQHRVVQTQPPTTPLGQFSKWRWTGSAWTAATDYRGHAWYNPANTDEVHVAQSFDDAPPYGWVWWAPGQNKVAGEAETLARAKAAKWGQVKATRDLVEYGNFTWDGSTFNADAESRNRIMGAVQLATLAAGAGQPYAVVWTLADNGTRTLSAADMMAVGAALGARVGSAHARAAALRTQINAATTLSALEAIDITTGW